MIVKKEEGIQGMKRASKERERKVQGKSRVWRVGEGR